MTEIQITPAPSAAPAVPVPAITSPEQLAGSPVIGVYDVHGMSCGNCAAHVTEELSAIEGVTGVQVDLEAKKVTVGSARQLSDEEVREAVDEAGYELG